MGAVIPQSLMHSEDTEILSHDFEIASDSSQLRDRRIQEIRHEILQAIQTRRQAILTATHKELRIQLRPARLGRLVVTVAQKDQEVTVHIQASTREAQRLLLSEFSQLETDLQEQGIKLANLEVSVGGESDFHQSHHRNPFFTNDQRRSARWTTANRIASTDVHTAPPEVLRTDGRLNLMA